MEQSEEWMTGHKYITFESKGFDLINRLKKEFRSTKLVT